MPTLRELICQEIAKTPPDTDPITIWVGLQQHDVSRLWRVTVIFPTLGQTVVSPETYAQEADARAVSASVNQLIAEETQKLGLSVEFGKPPNRAALH